jgi:hypothetical protein
MSKSNLTRVLLVALLAGLPAIAAYPPPVTIRIGGAEPVGPNHWQVVEGTTLGIAVHADPGTLITLFATAIDDQGQPLSERAMILLMGRAPYGQIAGAFKVPRGLAGKSFQLQAVAEAEGARPEWSAAIIVEVVPERTGVGR